MLPIFLPTDHQLSSGSTCNPPSSLDQKVTGAALSCDKAFRTALALTLDLAELQVVESVGAKRKEKEGWIGARAGRDL